MTAAVVDTNVPVVANGRQTHASDRCRLACIEYPERVVAVGKVALDQDGGIFEQYKDHLNFSGEPGVGDMFFKHVFDSMYVPERVEQVTLTRIADDHRQFDEFPSDLALSAFDRGDVIFVAVARAGPGGRPIINATDGDWTTHRQALTKHGVTVRELCPDMHQAQSTGTSR